MTRNLKPADTGAGPATTTDARLSRPTKLNAARGTGRRLLVALGAAPVFYGFSSQLLTLAQVLGANA